ncbi:MAG: hypothetical protein WA549_06165 [Thermoplasmata archaeon]
MTRPTRRTATPPTSAPVPRDFRSPRDHVEREALDLLDRQVAPRLAKEHKHLEKVVRSVVAHQRLEELAARPERDRRDLLEVLEERVRAVRGHVSPSAVVRLTNILSAIPIVDDPLGRWRTSPAR